MGATDLTVTTAEGAQILFDNFTGGTANQLFAGVIDMMASFTSVTLTNSTNGDSVELDNVKFGVAAVPEPGTLALFGLGLAGLGFARRRKAD